MAENPSKSADEAGGAISSMALEVREIDRHLGTLSRATDKTAHAIIDATERLYGLARWMNPSKRAAFEAELTGVLEACAFGDLFGQRLQQSQVALLRLATKIDNLEPTIEESAGTRMPSAGTSPGKSEQSGLSQREIDSFFE